MGVIHVVTLPIVDGLVPRVLRRALCHRYRGGLGVRRSFVLVLEPLGSQTTGR